MVRLRIHVAVLRGHILDLILACIGVVGQLILDLFLFLAGNLVFGRSERPLVRRRIPCQFDRLFSCLTICKAMRPRLDRLVILIQIQLCIFDCHRASGHAVLRGYSADLIISRTVPRKGISADIGNMRSTIVDMFHQNSNRVLQERIGRSNLGNFLFPDRIRGGFGRSHGDAAVGLILDSTTLGGAPTLEVITLKGRSCARNGEGGTASVGLLSLRSRRVFTAIGIIVQGILDFRIGLGLGDIHRVFHGAFVPLRIPAVLERITALAEGVVKTDGNDRTASLLGRDIDLQAVCAVKIAALPCADDNVLLAVIRLLHFHDIRVAGGRLCAAVGHGIIGGSGVSAGHLIDGHHFELAIPAGLQRVAGSERLVTDQ